MIKKKEIEVNACDYCGGETLGSCKIEIKASNLHVLSYTSSIDICHSCWNKIIPKMREYLKSIGLVNFYDIKNEDIKEEIKTREKELISFFLGDDKL